MALSICIATYNRLPHLKKLIDSIHSGFEDYPYEIIIADGGSADGTLEYLRKQKDVRLIEIGEITGIIKSLNMCFKKAKYEYIFFPNDDMVVFPEVLIKCCKLLDKYPEIGMVSPKMIESSRSNFPNVGIWNYRLIVSKLYILRTGVFRKIGFFNEKFRSYFVDAYTTLDLLSLGYVILYSREVGAIHFRIHDTIRRVNKSDKNAIKKESKYYIEKWKYLEQSLHASTIKEKKAFIYWALQNKMRKSRIMKRLMQKNRSFAIKLFDWFLQRCVIFRAKEYNHLKDFYLAQRLPKEVLKNKK